MYAYKAMYAYTLQIFKWGSKNYYNIDNHEP